VVRLVRKKVLLDPLNNLYSLLTSLLAVFLSLGRIHSSVQAISNTALAEPQMDSALPLLPGDRFKSDPVSSAEY
jgi:hypothetical protein